METVYDQLVAAGAPALPSAMAYRVEVSSLGDLVVDVVALKRRGKSELVSRRRVDLSSATPDTITAAIVKAATAAFTEAKTPLVRADAVNAWVGTYGPDSSRVATVVGA